MRLKLFPFLVYVPADVVSNMPSSQDPQDYDAVYRIDPLPRSP